MAYGDQGTRATATGWNELTTKVNKVFGDVHAGSAPTTDTNLQLDYMFGWGNTAQADTVATGDLIEASVFNSAIDIVNVEAHVTGKLPYSPDPIFFARRDAGEKVSLNDSDLGQTLQYYTSLIYNNKNNLAPSHASVITPAGGIVERTTPWKSYMAASFQVSFDSYDKLRYFFNSGGQIKITPTYRNGNSKGYLDWKYLSDQAGDLIVSVNGASCTGNIGIQAPNCSNIYQLNQTYQLMLTAQASFSGNYGGYGYGGYSGYGGYGYSAYTGIQIKVWGRLVGNNKLLIKVIYDNRAFSHWIDGVTGFQVTYKHADPEVNIQNDQVVFEVDPPTGLAVLNSFSTQGDDS